MAMSSVHPADRESSVAGVYLQRAYSSSEKTFVCCCSSFTEEMLCSCDHPYSSYSSYLSPLL